MKVSKLSRALCLILVLAFGVGVIVAVPASAAGNPTSADASLNDMRKYLAADSYAAYNEKYLSEGIQPGSASATSVPDMAASDDGVYLIDRTIWLENIGGTEEDYVGHENAVWSPATGSTVFSIQIPSTGMYYIAIEYYTVAQTVNSIERKLYIDGELPFSEANLLSLSKSWVYRYKRGVDADGNDTYATVDDVVNDFDTDTSFEFSHDVNGNDLIPTIGQYARWQTYFCSDSEGYSSDYYKFYLTEGTHTISLGAIRESVVIGAVHAIPVNDPVYGVPTYKEYLARYEGQPDAPAGTTITLEAEKPTLVSDSSVAMSNNKNSAITSPSTPFSDLYNVIGASSYSAVGQWAAYNFTVPESGMYEISLRYLQSALEGMFISRSIRITSNGKVGEDELGYYGLPDGTASLPFREAFNTRFNYSKNWTISSLTDGNDSFKFYFKKDVPYTIYFEVSLGALAEQLQIVEEAMTQLNDCYLQILKLTGSTPTSIRITTSRMCSPT